jgi:putative acetyltransferase
LFLTIGVRRAELPVGPIGERPRFRIEERLLDERPIEIRRDDPAAPHSVALLQEHLAEVGAISPPESTHAVLSEGLVARDAAFWTAWRGTALLGCGALTLIGPGHGEIKAMRTRPAARRSGVARSILKVIVEEAERRGCERVTGPEAQPEFEPARSLYRSFGFVATGPFAAYREDPNSAFFTKRLRPD